jgi:alpha-1,3-glucosyltransferase
MPVIECSFKALFFHPLSCSPHPPSQMARLTAASAPPPKSPPSRLALLLAFLVPRVFVSLGPHSGQSSPPMFGDFEAQRHWMEVTTSVPLRDWYRDAPGNNLTYWGLDYPPLSAYFARVLGDVSRASVPALVAPKTSWGHEGLAGKIFMRASVIAADALVLLPAVALLTLAAEHTTLAVLVLSQPGLLVIDHGHFQYNGVGVREVARVRNRARSTLFA